MNPVLVKALIISGGTLGVGVPGIYYGYPHIAKLISPEVKSSNEESSPQGNSKPITITQEGKDSLGQIPKEDNSGKERKNTDPSSTEENGDSDTNTKNTESEAGREENTERSGVTDGSIKNPSTLPPSSIPARASGSSQQTENQ